MKLTTRSFVLAFGLGVVVEAAAAQGANERPRQGERAAPVLFASGTGPWIETTWADPNWAIAVSDSILRPVGCVAPLPCDPESWFDQVASPPCYPNFTRFFALDPKSSLGGAATSLAELVPWPVDGLYVRAGYSFQLYSDPFNCQPALPVTAGDRYVTLDLWGVLAVPCGGVGGGTLMVPGGAGGLDGYSILVCPDGTCTLPFDCNANGIDDHCELTTGLAPDCDGNGVPDSCDIVQGRLADCNLNGIPDLCEISSGAVLDCNGNGIPDGCEPGALARVFVSAGAPPGRSGQGWASAVGDLQAALQLANTCLANLNVEVWVAEGVYVPQVPSGAVVQTATFALPPGVRVYGGFAGDETALDQRDPVANPTILSGDRNGDDQITGIKTDNCYHVVTLPALGAGTVLDGFVIEGGSASVIGGSEGAALRVLGGQHEVRRATIRDNSALALGVVHLAPGATLRLVDSVLLRGSAAQGAGVFAGIGSKFVAQNCSFEENAAALSGGAIRAIQAELQITGSHFRQNTCTNLGGAISLEGGTMEFSGGSIRDSAGALFGGAVRLVSSTATFTGTLFENNQSLDSGGAIDLAAGSAVSVLNCNFQSNRAPRGGAIHALSAEVSAFATLFQGNQALTLGGGGLLLFQGSTGIVDSCQFVSNTAAATGAGVYCENGSSVDLRRSTFTQNTGTSGLGLYVRQASAVVAQCTFTGHSATQNGGAVQITVSSTATLDECNFSGNSGQRGGALSFFDSQGIVRGSTFSGNTASLSGGAIDVRGSSPFELGRSLLTGNQSPSGGAVLNTSVSPVTVWSSAFRQNTSSANGGAFVEQNVGPTLITGCLFENNTAAGNGGAVELTPNGNLLVRLSTFVNNSANGGGGVAHAGPGTYTSTIFWNNSSNSSTVQNKQIQAFGPSLANALRYCTVQGWTGSHGGVANNGVSPGFVNLVGGDTHLPLGSGALSSAEPGLLLVPGEVDRDGEPRPVGAGLERGADEIVDCNANGVLDYLEFQAGLLADCNANGLSDACDIASGASADLNGDGVPDDCLSFVAEPAALSAATGGLQHFQLRAGKSFAFVPYFVVGSTSGTTPGFPLDAVVLPLNFDSYMLLTLSLVNTELFQNTFGFLNAQGEANARLLLPPVLPPSAVGATFHHAYFLISTSGIPTVAFASNPQPLQFLP